MTPTLSPVSERTKEIVRLAKEGEIERLLVDDPDRLMEENKDAPFRVDEVVGAGVGGADKRANSAKLSASDDIS